GRARCGRLQLQTLPARAQEGELDDHEEGAGDDQRDGDQDHDDRVIHGFSSSGALSTSSGSSRASYAGRVSSLTMTTLGTCRSTSGIAVARLRRTGSSETSSEVSCGSSTVTTWPTSGRSPVWAMSRPATVS